MTCSKKHSNLSQKVLSNSQCWQESCCLSGRSCKMIFFCLPFKIQKMFCKVQGCRYPAFHVSAGHECGKCHMFGHGQYECVRPERVAYSLTDRLPLNMQCQMPDCFYKEYHITSGHLCGTCRKWGSECTCAHKTAKCPVCRMENRYTTAESLKIFGISQKCSVCMEKDIEIYLPVCKHACLCKSCLAVITQDDRREMKGSDEVERVFQTARVRLGNQNNVYVIEYVGQGCAWYLKRVEGTITGFFLHGDNHGQYGPSTNDIPRLETFLAGCTEVN